MEFINKIIKENSSIFDVNSGLSLDLKKILHGENLKPSKKKLAILISDNTIGFIFFYIYLLKKNFAVMLLGKNITLEELIGIKKKYHPSDVALPLKFLKKLNFQKDKIYKSKYDYCLYEENSSKKFKIHRDLCLLLSTSGTTGSRKFVKLSYKNLLSNIKGIVGSLNINKKDKTITTMPAEYSYGLSVINSHLFVGAKIILNNLTLFDRKFLESVTKLKVTNLNGVPFFFDLIKKINFFNKINCSNIKFITQAGGSLSEDTKLYILNEINKLKKDFYIMYGSTETSPRMSLVNFYKYQKIKQGCIGLPISDYKFRLNKNTGKIFFYGKNIFKGYSKNYKSLLYFKNYKFIDTGDIGRLDKDGFYYVTGRTKRIIKISGERISLDEVEQSIKKNLKLKICCFGIDDKLIMFHTKNHKNSYKILNFTSKNLSINKNYIKIYHIYKFPISERGKIDYEELQRISKIDKKFHKS